MSGDKVEALAPYELAEIRHIAEGPQTEYSRSLIAFSYLTVLRLLATIYVRDAEIKRDRAFCICGCPDSEHESYGEDGESCENPRHECTRVCAAAASIVESLRFEVARLTEITNDAQRRLDVAREERDEIYADRAGKQSLIEQWEKRYNDDLAEIARLQEERDKAREEKAELEQFRDLAPRVLLQEKEIAKKDSLLRTLQAALEKQLKAMEPFENATNRIVNVPRESFAFWALRCRTALAQLAGQAVEAEMGKDVRALVEALKDEALKAAVYLRRRGLSMPDLEAAIRALNAPAHGEKTGTGR